MGPTLPHRSRIVRVSRGSSRPNRDDPIRQGRALVWLCGPDQAQWWVGSGSRHGVNPAPPNPGDPVP